MVDYEYVKTHLELNILMSVPEISTMDSGSTMEHLTPLKYNLSSTCCTGAVTQKNLLLITCKYSQTLITTEALDKCFKDENTVLCPTNLLEMVSNTEWLGFPRNSNLKLSFPQSHIRAKNCNHLHPILHLGRRYFLATTTGTLELNSGTLDIFPPTIYHLPSNASFSGMKTGLSECPDLLQVTVPLFTPSDLQYVPWKPFLDHNPLKIYYQLLTIPPPTTALNKTVLDAINQLYQTLDRKLTEKIHQAGEEIDTVT